MALTVSFGCAPNDVDTYTLYRDSILNRAERIHVASFDADEPDDYNQQNCELARGLHQDQRGVKVRYWCEKGRYRE